MTNEEVMQGIIEDQSQEIDDLKEDVLNLLERDEMLRKQIEDLEGDT